MVDIDPTAALGDRASERVDTLPIDGAASGELHARTEGNIASTAIAVMSKALGARLCRPPTYWGTPRCLWPESAEMRRRKGNPMGLEDVPGDASGYG